MMGDLTDMINAQLDDDQPAHPPNINANYLAAANSYSMTICSHGGWVVKFNNDGTVEFNPDLSPAEGSERAWHLLKQHALGPVQGSLDLSRLRIDEDTPAENDPGFNARLGKPTWRTWLSRLMRLKSVDPAPEPEPSTTKFMML